MQALINPLEAFRITPTIARHAKRFGAAGAVTLVFAFLSQGVADSVWPPPAEIFVANYSDSVRAYAPGRRGNVPPDRMIGLRLAPVGIARDSAGKIYVTNHWLDSIAVFAADAEGAAAPIAIIRGSRTGLDLPNGIAIDARGKIYVVNGSSDDDRPPGRIDVYRPGSNGNAAPVAVIKGHRTKLENPQDVAVDSSGKIYVTDTGGDDKKSPDRVMVFAAASNGDAAPIATIIGSRTALDLPNGIAVDSQGKIYVANAASGNEHAGPGVGSDYDPDADSLDVNFDDRITVYPAGAHGNVAPIATIEGGNTGLGDPHGIALDSDGRIYVTNQRFIGDPYRQSVTVFGAGARGDAAPITTIQGQQTALNHPEGIAVSAQGAIYVASRPRSGPGLITIYAANSAGDVKPRITITDAVDMGLQLPMGIALDAAGQIYVANINHVAVYAAGAARNAPPLFTIGGAKTKLLRPWGIAVDSQKNIYVADPNVGAHGSVLVYPAGSRGDVSPSAILGAATPVNVAVDSRGNIYVKCLRGGSDHQGMIAVYGAGARDGTRPIATIRGKISGPPYSSGIAVDTRGRIYVAPAADGGVEVYPPLTSLVSQPGYPEVKPVATIGGPRSRLVYPLSIALDSSDRLYVLNFGTAPSNGGLPPSGSASLAVFPPLGVKTGKVDPMPLYAVAGPDAQLDEEPIAIALWGGS